MGNDGFENLADTPPANLFKFNLLKDKIFIKIIGIGSLDYYLCNNYENFKVRLKKNDP